MREVIIFMWIIYLAYIAYYDMRYMEIPVIAIGFGFILDAFSLVIINTNWSIFDLLSLIETIFVGCIPGLLICLICIFSKHIGEADAIVFLQLGMILQERIFSLFLYSLLFSSIISLILLLKSRFNLKKQIPFIPFIVVALVVICIKQKDFLI